ncbi:MAG TPA: 2-dehydro-3-deoxygalactonokinase [Verrucomicrobiae bacterium]
MAANQEFLSCDWGTTSFRLRWVSGTDCRVLREIRGAGGIKTLHDEALRRESPNESNRGLVFERFLHGQLEKLREDNSPRSPLPLVLSGMASSSIGWRELPYAATPFSLDGEGLIAEELDWNKPEWIGPTCLISGVATQHEMMRGEETEAIGLMWDPGLTALRQRSLLILPGTHSKHIWIEDQRVVHFRTFMTGELFDVLGRQSLLRASVNLDSRAPLSEPDRAAFQEGARWGKDNGLAGGLFRVRTRAVLDRSPLTNNTWFFSGLLIGAELASVCANAGSRPVILAATRALSELYGMAFATIADKTMEWIQLPAEQVERATIIGHSLFLRNRSNRNAIKPAQC